MQPSACSAFLQPEGPQLLQTLVGPLRVYPEEWDELLMVSSFADDLQIQKGNRHPAVIT